MNLTECRSVIYWSFDSPLTYKSNSSGLLLMMSNKMYNTVAEPIATLYNLLISYYLSCSFIFSR
jgi:hypothetical protein